MPAHEEQVFIEDIETRIGRLTIVASDDAILRVSLSSRSSVVRRLTMLGYKPQMGGNDTTREAGLQLVEYLAGGRRWFSVPLEPRGTEFQRRVWSVVSKIPYGEVWSYAKVAREAGVGQAYRAVGNAVGANPIIIMIPCHRVVRSDNTLGGYGGLEDIKEKLLELEGVISKITRKSR
ncbi:MAG: methylated-DNA--[protein]-cysteine S-methyltransferase [Aigarchaeota archaeon]|nr:methylated-DNA--[protein]-cysteine S-methyltransferase [Candidatus Pelearchaeum maunauluense]